MPRLEDEGAQRFVVVELPGQPDPVIAVDWTKLLNFRTDLGSSRRQPVRSAWVIAPWDQVVIGIPVTMGSEVGGADAGFLHLNPY